ncbi:PAS domain S-box/diguanylate cyclase (GGDEF) domain-containing protein [Thauera phenylacetica B4P]|uniref:PAS domain S-box/diguanylate cyclase (GGDEF) domain-containing protein n=1 Tax=Thauera phenylacetica B4P TaxID=1234382 RepID=N6ZWV9_9RHOO|nr:PAS domain S-box/diguanylate cyclase (GGDEF) domain-containing protein [Thauera phenylacetica B4P]
MRRTRGIAFRTTASILVFGGLVGGIAAVGSAKLIEHKEHRRLNDALVESMAAVQRTASVAAYARDEQLAAEVVAGLLQSSSVAHAEILEGDTVLAAVGANTASASPNGAALRGLLRSPFDASETIGELRVIPASAFIAAKAADYSRLVASLLAVLVLSITLGVAWLVGRGVTRGIGRLAGELHGLDVVSGSKVTAPAGHAEDELGRLAGDINALLERMDAALAREREARGLHAAAERKWRLIFDNAGSGLFTLDAQGGLVEWNAALVRALGLKDDECARGGASLAELLGDGAGRLERMRAAIVEGSEAASADFERRDADGGSRWLHVVLNAVEGGGELLQGIVNDITERKHAEDKARAQAERDALTGLLNRRGLERAYSARLHEYAGTAGLGVLLVDLDGFKWVNDNHGHEAGDELLQLVARRIEGVVRRSDKVARIGGDEFVLLLDDLKSMSMARNIAAKLVDVLSQPFAVLDGCKVRIGASVGVVFTQYPSGQMAELLRRADAAMYEAKKAGKSQYCFAFPV